MSPSPPLLSPSKINKEMGVRNNHFLLVSLSDSKVIDAQNRKKSQKIQLKVHREAHNSTHSETMLLASYWDVSR